MVIPEKSVLQETFSKVDQSTKQLAEPSGYSLVNRARCFTRRPSSKEYQASRTHHYGYEPRVSVPVTPAEFLAGFSFRFVGGENLTSFPLLVGHMSVE